MSTEAKSSSKIVNAIACICLIATVVLVTLQAITLKYVETYRGPNYVVYVSGNSLAVVAGISGLLLAVVVGPILGASGADDRIVYPLIILGSALFALGTLVAASETPHRNAATLLEHSLTKCGADILYTEIAKKLGVSASAVRDIAEIIRPNKTCLKTVSDLFGVIIYRVNTTCLAEQLAKAVRYVEQVGIYASCLKTVHTLRQYIACIRKLRNKIQKIVKIDNIH